MMMRVFALFTLLALNVALIGCAQPHYDMPYGADAYHTFPAASTVVQPAEYKIGAFDKVNVTVYREPDLSATDLPVDAAGAINMPLIGNVQIEGKTAVDASSYIADLYNQKYLRDAQVTVTVTEAVSKRVIVEGEVNTPGVFPIQGRMTLLEALAQARGTTKTAANKEIVVFRVVDGHRMGGRFNLNDIRQGKADDPELKGNDTVVVGYSQLKGGYRDFLSSAPLLGIMTRF